MLNKLNSSLTYLSAVSGRAHNSILSAEIVAARTTLQIHTENLGLAQTSEAETRNTMGCAINLKVCAGVIVKTVPRE